MIPIHRFVCSLIILALVCIAGIPGADCSELTVAPSGAEFTSIQAAIDWAYPWRHHYGAQWYLHRGDPA